MRLDFLFQLLVHKEFSTLCTEKNLDLSRRLVEQADECELLRTQVRCAAVTMPWGGGGRLQRLIVFSAWRTSERSMLCVLVRAGVCA
jgi:hypothetical protein